MSSYFWNYFYGKQDPNDPDNMSPIHASSTSQPNPYRNRHLQQTRRHQHSPYAQPRSAFPRNRSHQNLNATIPPTGNNNSPNSHVLYIDFAADSQCFACGTENGFFIYNCDPYVERFRRKMQGGIGIAELMGKSNIVFLVGGGIRPEFSPNKVIIWDDYQSIIAHELEYTTEVLNVKSRTNRIAITLYHQTLIYKFETLELEHQYDTYANPLGLTELNSDASVLVTLGNQMGDIRIEHLNKRKSHIINAHKTNIGCFALNPEGSLLATCSQKGTLIRVWDTTTGKLIKELRRGIEQTQIISLSFNKTSSFLCLSSEKGTIHIYSLRPRQEVRKHEKNKKSTLSFMNKLPLPLPVSLPTYFSSEWSCFSFSLPHNQIGKCNFSPNDPNALIILTDDGRYLKYRIDNGTSAHLTEKQHIVD